MNRPLTLKHVLLCLCAFVFAGAGLRYYMDSAVIDTLLDIKGSSAPAASNAGQTRLYVDSTSNALKSSSNGETVYRSIMQRKNLLINGGCRVNQRNVSSGSTTSAYGPDRWNCVIATGNSVSIQFSNTGTSGGGTVNSDMISPVAGVPSLIVAQTSVSAGSILLLRQTIEKQDIPYEAVNNGLTLSFWASSNVTGQYGVWLGDIPDTKAAMTTINIAQADTWQKFVINFGNVPSSLPSGNTSAAGLELDICLTGGSNYQGTASTTFSTTLYSGGVGGVAEYTTSSQANTWANNLTHHFYFTDVQLEVGQKATQFEMLPYQQELALCQRYCYVNASPGGASNNIIGVGYVNAGTVCNAQIVFPVQMRTRPTMSFSGTIGHISIGNQANASPVTTNPPTNAALANTSSCDFLTFTASGLTGVVAGQGAVAFWNSSSTTADMLIFNADF